MRWIWRHRFRRTTLWLALFISILAGLGLARTGSAPGTLFTALFTLMAMIGWRKRSLSVMLAVIIAGTSCGWARGAVYMEKLSAYEPLYGQKLTITVRASDDAIYNKYKSLSFNAADVTLEDGTRLVGGIQLSGFGTNAVFQDDIVIATGKLMPGYGSYQGRMGFATLQVIERHPSLLTEIKRRFVAGAQTALPDPLAPFIMGLLVGQRANLPESVKEDLRTVGLTHIIAVSGANLTIILQAMRRLLGKRSKRISTFLTVGLIGVFLLLTGFSASIVRAAIVSMLSIAAGYYGRSFKPFNLIAFAAVITSMANPIYIWSDLGWYLSFLAFYGILILAPLVQNRWPGKWHQNVIAGVALESICAEIMTLPFVLHIFGQMSRASLVANVLVVAFIPLAMLLGTIAGLAGMLAGGVSGWFAWPAVQLLNYMLDTAHIIASLPNVLIEGIGLSLFQMLFLYACIMLLTAIMWYKNPSKSAIITDMSQSKSRGLMA